MFDEQLTNGNYAELRLVQIAVMGRLFPVCEIDAY